MLRISFWQNIDITLYKSIINKQKFHSGSLKSNWVTLYRGSGRRCGPPSMVVMLVVVVIVVIVTMGRRLKVLGLPVSHLKEGDTLKSI